MEVLYSASPGLTTYGNVFRLEDGYVWRTTTSAFEVYSAANVADYDVPGTEYGSSGEYHMTFPVGITDGGGFKVVFRQQAGGAPAESDLVIWDEIVWWDGTLVTPPPAPSGSPEQVTGYLYVYDEDGNPEAGVTITCSASGFADDAASVGIATGFALDTAVRSAVSDVNGLVSFPNMFKGVYYSVSRSGDGGFSAKIPADAANPYKLPSIMGTP